MLVLDSNFHRHVGRVRAGILAALILLAAAGLVVLGLWNPGDSSAPDGGLGLPGRRVGDSLQEESHAGPTEPSEVAPAAQRPLEPRDRIQDRESVDPSSLEGGEDVPPSWSLRLTVVDSNGRPIDGARIEVESPGPPPPILEQEEEDTIVKTTSPGEHRFLIDGPEPESSEVAPFAQAIVSWTPKPGEPEASLEVVLRRAARIIGSLSCTDGSSPASAGIDIFHVATEEWSNAAAIDDGTFVSSWMPAGQVIVYSRNGSWSETDLKERETLTLSEGQSHPYHGSLAPAIDLAGTIVDTAGRPLANISVDVYDELNPAYSESVLSGEDGGFLCDGLYPGTYLLDLPRSVGTPKARFTVPRGSTKVDMGNLVFRIE